MKAQFIPAKKRKLFFLLASKNGFTEEVKSIQQDPNLILIDQI